MAPEYYIFTGRRIPDYVTHVLIDKSLKFVPASVFYLHQNIQELICHDGVVKIERMAFYTCPSLRRVIMPGVKEVEKNAFRGCRALTYIECGRLEIIGAGAFSECTSLNSVDLSSIKHVAIYAFSSCKNLTNVKFGEDLETIGMGVFHYCRSLERITLPLKDGMITDDDIIRACDNLNHIDLFGGVHETIAALLMDEWKHDMNDEIGTISQNLEIINDGDKTREIQTWIRSVLGKIVHYKAEHNRILNEAAATLQPALPNDIVLKNIFPFIELPSFTFEGEH